MDKGGFGLPTLPRQARQHSKDLWRCVRRNLATYSLHNTNLAMLSPPLRRERSLSFSTAHQIDTSRNLISSSTVTK